MCDLNKGLKYLDVHQSDHEFNHALRGWPLMISGQAEIPTLVTQELEIKRRGFEVFFLHSSREDN